MTVFLSTNLLTAHIRRRKNMNEDFWCVIHKSYQIASENWEYRAQVMDHFYYTVIQGFLLICLY